MLNNKMKKKILKIPWDKIDHPSNSAKIPETLEELIVDKNKNIDGCYWKLVNATVPSLELYESAFYIIPILLNMLNAVHSDIKVVILRLLYEILLGDAPAEKQIKLGMPSECHQVFIDDEIIWRIPLKLACRNAVSMGLEAYLEILKTENADCKKEVAFILSEFTELEDVILPDLKAILKKEVNDDVRQAILDTINDLQKE